MSTTVSPRIEVLPVAHEFTDPEIRTLVDAIEHSGYAVIPRFIGSQAPMHAGLRATDVAARP